MYLINAISKYFVYQKMWKFYLVHSQIRSKTWSLRLLFIHKLVVVVCLTLITYLNGQQFLQRKTLLESHIMQLIKSVSNQQLYWTKWRNHLFAFRTADKVATSWSAHLVWLWKDQIKAYLCILIIWNFFHQ